MNRPEPAARMQLFCGPAEEWDRLAAELPGAHFLQTTAWAEVKAAVGWKALQVVWVDGSGRTCAAAMVLMRSLSLGRLNLPVRILYSPRGPLLDWQNPALLEQVLSDLQVLAHQQGAIFIKIDPAIVTGWGLPGTADYLPVQSGAAAENLLKRQGWIWSNDQIQFRSTVLVDLAPAEEGILDRMKQKTRYNIRLAARKGVQIRTAQPDDLPVLYHMYAETSLRDGFVIRSEEYYLRLWRLFMERGLAEGLVASVDGEDIAGLVAIRYAGTAWYAYGMSRQAHREKMPNYLLQWEAMQRARKAGCREYDLWGAPEKADENDPLWSVYRFKEGLGGTVRVTSGAWDYPAKPHWYEFYTHTLPKALAIMRWRGRRRTSQEVSSI